MCAGYTVVKEWEGEAKALADAAREASRDAVAKTFAAGLPITVAKDGKLVRIAPYGAETVIRDL